MKRTFQMMTAGLSPGRVARTYGIGAVGGLVALWLGLPLGMLLGSLICVALAASRGVEVEVPQSWRYALIPVIGVAIGSGFTVDTLAQAKQWWISAAMLLLYVPLAHGIAFMIYLRIGKLDRPTAYWAGMPGGLIESLTLGEERGADVMMLTMLQFLRLMCCIIMVPLGFALFTGQSVGSSAGVTMPGADLPIGLLDVALLVFAGVAGAWGGAWLRLPGAIILGPILLSAAIHMAGLTEVSPPGWTLIVTQWVIGTSLGTRFAGFRGRHLNTALRLAAMNAAVTLALAGLAGVLLAPMVDEPMAAVFLAYAPGGIAEMALVAVSLQLSAVYVTFHHLVRIVLTVAVARAFSILGNPAP